MTLARFINKKGILRFIDKKVDAFTYLKHYTTPLKDPDKCEHIDLDQYNEYELICLDCGMIMDCAMNG